jgi:hypothetical protein
VNNVKMTGKLKQVVEIKNFKWGAVTIILLEVEDGKKNIEVQWEVPGDVVDGNDLNDIAPGTEMTFEGRVRTFRSKAGFLITLLNADKVEWEQAASENTEVMDADF